MSEVGDVLERAADLLDKPGAWTQGAYGRNAMGTTVPEYADDCVCRCAVGAIWAATGAGRDASVKEVQPCVTALVSVLPVTSVTDWNDYPARTQTEVVEALRQAASLARRGDQS